MAELIEELNNLKDNSIIDNKLRRELLEICQAVHLIVTTKPKSNERPTKEAEAKRPDEDREAMAAYQSALTKYDDLSATFQRGAQARDKIQKELLEEVFRDLVKDYHVVEDIALKRANKMVRQQVGKSYAAWLKAAEGGS